MKTSGGPVAVIGGGIVGSSIAWHLADRGMETILIDRGGASHGASTASFSSIGAFDEPGRDLYLLKTAAMSSWRRWEKRLGDDVGLRWDGDIRWEREPESARALTRKVWSARDRGYPVELISPAKLTQRLPAASPGKVEVASLAWEDGHVEPNLVIEAVRRDLHAGGHTVIIGQAKLAIAEDSIEVVIGDEKIVPGSVVLAAGPETADFASAIGFDIAMKPSPGLMVETKPVPEFVRGIVYAPGDPGPRIHLRQRKEGRVLVGEGTQETLASAPTVEHGWVLLRQAARYFPALVGVEIERVMVEWRPMPADEVPIVGPVPSLPSVFLATMHSGVTLAAVVGELVAQEIAEGTIGDRLTPFRPERFAQQRTQLLVDIESAFGGIGPEIYWG
jgi:glycine/D-amino acid oxidase-like deaminating enzyme